MPELPEVETVRIGLAKLLPGLTVKAVDSNWNKSFPNAENDTKRFLIDAKVVQVRRRAKVLIIDLSTNYSLIIHLKMTGQLVFVKNKSSASSGEHSSAAKQSSGLSRTKGTVKGATEDSNQKYAASQAKQATWSVELPGDEERWGAGHPNSSLVGNLPDKSTRVTFDFGSAKLFFNDQRKFGWVRLVPTIEIDNIDFFKKLGPEPLSADFTTDDFKPRIRKRPKSQVKPVLMDQTVIAGVGNIYADEALWGARIHPEQRVQDVSDKKLNHLYEELIYVLKLSIEKGGSTDKNYVDAEGKKGSYLKFARVFRRENLPCPRCGTTIIKMRVAGRGTHLCPECQKLK